MTHERYNKSRDTIDEALKIARITKIIYASQERLKLHQIGIQKLSPQRHDELKRLSEKLRYEYLTESLKSLNASVERLKKYGI